MDALWSRPAGPRPSSGSAPGWCASQPPDSWRRRASPQSARAPRAPVPGQDAVAAPRRAWRSRPSPGPWAGGPRGRHLGLRGRPAHRAERAGGGGAVIAGQVAGRSEGSRRKQGRSGRAKCGEGRAAGGGDECDCGHRGLRAVPLGHPGHLCLQPPGGPAPVSGRTGVGLEDVRLERGNFADGVMGRWPPGLQSGQGRGGRGGVRRGKKAPGRYRPGSWLRLASLPFGAILGQVLGTRAVPGPRGQWSGRQCPCP